MKNWLPDDSLRVISLLTLETDWHRCMPLIHYLPAAWLQLQARSDTATFGSFTHVRWHVALFVHQIFCSVRSHD